MPEPSPLERSLPLDAAVPSEPVAASVASHAPDTVAALLQRITDLERAAAATAALSAAAAAAAAAAAPPHAKLATEERRRSSVEPALENLAASLEREVVSAWRMLGWDEVPGAATASAGSAVAGVAAAASAAAIPTAAAAPKLMGAVAGRRPGLILLPCLLILLPLLVLAASLYLVAKYGGGTPAAPLSPGGIHYGRNAVPARRPT